MDTNRKTPTPEEVAEVIADARPVDWSACESSPAWRTAQLERLRRVEAVAEAFRHVPPAPPGGTLPGEPPAPLFRWGHLEVLEKLGEGSFGEVYRARDPLLQRQVALKLHHVQGGSRRGRRPDFLGEARRLAKVRHPNVVVVHGADTHDGRTGLWMDLIDGSTLASLVQQGGPLGPGEVMAIGADLCAALAAVHAAGLVHADVKASNVMRERGGRIVLMDFGAGIDLEAEGQAPVCGTPLVMAPELLRGELPPPASDLYSLGSLMYFLLTGCYPLEADTLPQLLARQRRGESIPLTDRRPDLPGKLVAVIERALDGDPGRRFASAGEMRRALADLTHSSDTTFNPAVGGRRAGLLRVAAVLLAGGAMGGGLALRHFAVRPPTTGPGTSAERLVVKASLYRAGPAGALPLASGGRVQPGDRLFLTLTAREAVHLYVVNQDQRGKVFVLFPLPGLRPGNPLPAGMLHRLPGEMNGKTHDWVVTSAGGEERFLLVAARRPLPEIEGELSNLATASPGRGTEPPTDEGIRAALRGVGGLAPAPEPADEERFHRLRRLLRQLEARGEVWLEEVTVANPAI